MYYSCGASLLFMKTCLDMYVYMDMLLETCFWLCIYVYMDMLDFVELCCWIYMLDLMKYVVGHVVICCWICWICMHVYLCVKSCQIKWIPIKTGDI